MPSKTTTKKVGTKALAADLLRQHGPLHVRDLTDKLIETGKTGLGTSGKTPAATVAAMLVTAAAKGDTFVKVAPATFGILGEHTAADAPEPPAKKSASTKGQDAAETVRVDQPRTDDESPAVVPGSVVVRDGKTEAKPDPKKPAAKKKSAGRSRAKA